MNIFKKIFDRIIKPKNCKKTGEDFENSFRPTDDRTSPNYPLDVTYPPTKYLTLSEQLIMLAAKLKYETPPEKQIKKPFRDASGRFAKKDNA
jgi:hypothetical protein